MQGRDLITVPFWDALAPSRKGRFGVAVLAVRGTRTSPSPAGGLERGCPDKDSAHSLIIPDSYRRDSRSQATAEWYHMRKVQRDSTYTRLKEVTQSIPTYVWRKYLCSELSRSLRREMLTLGCSMAVRSQQAGCRPLDPWAGLTSTYLKKREFSKGIQTLLEHATSNENA